MIVLHNKTTLPRDGFSFHYLPPSHPDKVFEIPKGHSFSEARSKLRAWISSNPWLNLPSDEASVDNMLLLYTFARLKSTLGLSYALQFFSAEASDDSDVAEAIKKKTNSMSPALLPEPRGVDAVLAAARSLGHGATTLAEWLGSGAKPVSEAQAQLRANTCMVCPMNEPGNWMDRLVKEVQSWIHRVVELKNQMELHVQNEEHLHMCTACKCPLALKVWVPTERVAKDTSERTREKLAGGKNCWILREIEPKPITLVR